MRLQASLLHVILIHSAYTYSTTTCSQMFPPVWFSFIAPELLCKSYMITTSCTALYHSSGFFIIMSPAEGLHFSALVQLIFNSFFCLCPVHFNTSSFPRNPFSFHQNVIVDLAMRRKLVVLLFSPGDI